MLKRLLTYSLSPCLTSTGHLVRHPPLPFPPPLLLVNNVTSAVTGNLRKHIFFCPKIPCTNVHCLTPSPLNIQLMLSRGKVNTSTAPKP